MCDFTPVGVNASTGQPVVSVLPSRLLLPLQSAVVGLAAGNRALFCFGGAIYGTSESLSPRVLLQPAAGSVADGVRVDESLPAHDHSQPHPGDDDSFDDDCQWRFYGGPGGWDKQFGVVLGFGVVCVLLGWWWLRTGRSPTNAVWVSGRRMGDGRGDASRTPHQALDGRDVAEDGEDLAELEEERETEEGWLDGGALATRGVLQGMGCFFDVVGETHRRGGGLQMRQQIKQCFPP